MPYLPIDPKDIGRSYDAVIRVNSQSGKGGISYLLESEHGLELPRRLQIEFSQVVQSVMDDLGTELTAADIWAIFAREYRLGSGDVIAIEHPVIVEQADAGVVLKADVRLGDRRFALRGEGNGPVDAFVDGVARAVDREVRVLDYHEHSIGAGAGARAAAYLELRVGEAGTMFGVGIDENILTATMKAVLSGLVRAGAGQPAREAEAVQ